MSSDAPPVARAPAVRPARATGGLQVTRLRWFHLAVGVVAVLAAAFAGVLVGAAELGWQEIVTDLLSRVPGVPVESSLSEAQANILWRIRIPRVVLGALVGATLASAGAAYQGVFRNPLADPYLLGASAGAGLAATLVIAYTPAGTRALLPLAAFVGALGGVALAYALGHAAGGPRATAPLILAGVAVAAFLAALQNYVQQQHADSLREVYAWMMGQLGTSGWSEIRLLGPYAAVSAVVLLLHRRLLDVLAVGDEEAGTLGVRSARVRLVVVAAASLGTAAAVAVSGLIGFVGIVVPHTVRLLTGVSYRVLLPLSLCFGAAFLVLSDLVARTIVSPAELPIGVVTAFFGAPFFALVLRTSRRTVM